MPRRRQVWRIRIAGAKMPSPEDLPPAGQKNEACRNSGGGPAGAFAAERLASAGLDVLVFDEKLAWRSLAATAVTTRPTNQYPFLIENRRPSASSRRPSWQALTRTKSAESWTIAADLLASGSPIVCYTGSARAGRGRSKRRACWKCRATGGDGSFAPAREWWTQISVS